MYAPCFRYKDIEALVNMIRLHMFLMHVQGDAAAESLAASSKLTELMRMLRANRASSRPANAGNDDAEYHISQPAPSTQKGAST